MSVSALMLCNDPSLCVLICDVQEKLTPGLCRADLLVHQCGKLFRAAHLFSRTVVVTEQYPKGLGRTVPPLLELINSSHGESSPPAARSTGEVRLVEKTQFSMVVPELEAVIDSHGQFILMGCEAHVCILQTAADLLYRGKRVFVAADGISSQSAEHCADAIATLRQWGCTVLPTDALLFQLIRGKDAPQFKELMTIVKS